MPPIDDDERDARIERANRLHEEIEALKSGKIPEHPAKPQSIREFVEERAREEAEKKEPE
jgi:hypothetical protein